MQHARQARRLMAANANSSAFTAKAATITEPSGTAVVNVGKLGQLVPARVMMWPIGLGSDNDVSSMRLWGWHRVVQDTMLDLWQPSIIGEWVCTFSTAVGVAGSAVLNTERYADTIAPVALLQADQKIAAGTSLSSLYEIFTPANNTPGWIIAPIYGVEKLEWDFDQTTGTPTQNVIFKFLEW
jgi:hypothetical protein